jgi:hypothetical protein
VHGGGATWLTGSYDPALKLLYWGTGNPGPDWNGDSRKGDNLYTSSLVAIDVETGKARWHFQFTPHDVHDWDANQIPVLVDTQVGGRPRSLVVTANRNGFFYALDRKTGEFVFATPYARQTWAKGIDDRGRPIEIPGMEPSEKGTLVYPSLQGSTNWSSPSYSPATDMLYVPVREMGRSITRPGVEYKPGTYYTGGAEKRLDEESWGAVRALDVKTGKQAWDFRLPSPPWAASCPRPADSSSADRTKATSTPSTRGRASRSGSSRPAARFARVRCPSSWRQTARRRRRRTRFVCLCTGVTAATITPKPRRSRSDGEITKKNLSLLRVLRARLRAFVVAVLVRTQALR